MTCLTTPPEPYPLTLALPLLAVLATGHRVSVAHLAAVTGLSGTVVRQQIDVLCQRGLPVNAHGTAGYALPWPIQMLDETRIRSVLPVAIANRMGDLELHEEVNSTSSQLRLHAVHRADFSVLIAETQCAGQGRFGRHWLSPPGLNLYLSCLKHVEACREVLHSSLSLAVGVMVMRALADQGVVTGVGLKWPNDVLAAGSHQCPGGKLAGILTERSGPDSLTVVTGVGLNLRMPEVLRAQLDQPVSDLATLCAGRPPDRNLMAAALIKALVEGITQFTRDGFAAFVEDYAKYDMLRGRRLELSSIQGPWYGVGMGVDAGGALRVRTPEGRVCRVDSSLVTVRCV